MKLTARQNSARDLLNSSASHILLDGGSRSGKTAVIVRNILVRALKAPKSRHAILRFHFKDVKESIGMDTLPKVMEMCWPHVPCIPNKSDWFFTLPNLSEIWLGGLDDKDRTEKVLGKEFATIFLGEVSQISWQARNMALTRLAQRCPYEMNGEKRELSLKMYYDCNPPSKSHWAYQVFHQKRDPETKNGISHPEDYAQMAMHPKDNAANLPPKYLESLEGMTGRMRRRFWEGAYGEVAPGALWTEELLDTYRVSELPDMQRIIVAVDPSGSDDTDNTDNDAIGIVVVGLGTDGLAYLIEDCTMKGSPKKWGHAACMAFDRHDADLIVGEKNYGGEMVRFVIQSQPNAGRQRPTKLVTASRGKAVRADPISSLHEAGKIRFVGRFAELEDELCSFTTNGYMGDRSPNRADAFVWAMSEIFPGIVESRKKTNRSASDFRPSLSAYAA